MKKGLSTILIFVAVLQIGGITPFYFYFLQIIKDQVAVELGSKDKFEPIFVSQQEYNNPEVFQKGDDNEFAYKGAEYDYQSVEKRGGDYVFYALVDHKQTSLMQILANEFQQNFDKNKASKGNPGKVIKDFFKDIIVSPSQNWISKLTNLNKVRTSCYSALLFDGHCNTIKWPPNLC